MARYLVTGAAGFIGSRLSQMLLEAGNEVIGVDNLNDAYDVRMKNYRLDLLCRHPGFTFSHIDISGREAVTTLGTQLKHIDAVFNLAARAGVRASIDDPWDYFETNQIGTLNLLELCRTNRIPKFILASTSSLYGPDAPQPTPEDADSCQPMHPYAASKKAAEFICNSYHIFFGIDVTIFRYFTVYGPAGRPDMAMFRFVQWISEGKSLHVFGDGSQSRGFTYVDDVVRGTILGLKPMGFEVINLGGRQTITINKLIDKLECCLERKAHIIYDPAYRADMVSNFADTEKAKTLLNWTPQVSIDEGLSRTAEWYNSQREWAKEIITL